MSFLSRFFGKSSAAPARSPPLAATQSAGVLITNPQQLDEYLRSGMEASSGAHVTPQSAMRVATVFACVRIRSGAVKNLPLTLMRRIDDKTRIEAVDHPLWALLKRKPNRWQTPSEFKQMLETHVQLRGNGYALKVLGVDGKLLELVPMAAHRTVTKQLDNLSIVHEYTTLSGRRVVLPQDAVMHLRGLTIDGITGVSPITFAREAIGLAMQTEKHGATLFKNGASLGLVLEHPQKLGPEAVEHLKASLESYKGSENAHKSLILEEGMKANNAVGMTSEDAQFLDTRKFQRTDIGMFWGVPPFMYGDTEKSTSWGTGIEQQRNGFLSFTLEDSLTMWEDAIWRDLIGDPNLYAHFNRSAFLRGDTKTRWESYVKARQWGVLNANEIRALEDMNPRTDPGGEEYAEPPNASGDEPKENNDDDKTQTAGD